ncbi:MAG: hypothetical protein DWQ05_09725 [Calditrichaeota bacterium]|nr:MAG: hypothetical protein DWQ05_09725 [Calditrichota bacterium]
MRKNSVIKLRFIFIYAMHTSLFSIAGFSQTHTIKIVELRSYTKNESIGANLVLAPFFSEKVSGTIQSGLPSVLEIELLVRDRNDKNIGENRIIRRISYNIWDEKYRIDSPDTSLFFTLFADLQNTCLLLKSTPFITRNKLDENHLAQIYVRGTLRLISSSQSRKLAGWLDASAQAPETISSDESSSGFRLNFSALVSLFMGNSPERRTNAPWQQFPFPINGRDQ